MSKYSHFLTKYSKRLREYPVTFRIIIPLVMRAFKWCFALFLSGCLVACGDRSEKKDGPLQILFLGHPSEHHNSAAYMPMLASALALEGIQFTYTERVSDLNEENLAKYDGLMIYANHEEISPEQEKALLNFVAEGNGFIP